MAEVWESVDIPTHRLKAARWVKTVVRIRRNATGEIREYPMSQILEDDESEPSTFNWSENNFSCDCNRQQFFVNGGGEEAEGDDECTDGRYSVQLVNAANGRIYYNEFDQPLLP